MAHGTRFIATVAPHRPSPRPIERAVLLAVGSATSNFTVAVASPTPTVAARVQPPPTIVMDVVAQPMVCAVPTLFSP